MTLSVIVPRIPDPFVSRGDPDFLPLPMPMTVLVAIAMSIGPFRLDIDNLWLLFGLLGLVYGMTQDRRPNADGDPFPSMPLFASRQRG